MIRVNISLGHGYFMLELRSRRQERQNSEQYCNSLNMEHESKIKLEYYTDGTRNPLEALNSG